MKSPPSADIFSYVYDIMFEEDVTKEIEELQQEVRIRRECKPNPDIRHDNFYTTTQHPDSVVTTISCEPVHYRIPQGSIQNIDDSIVFGVLSGGPDGPARRASIRNTWGHGSPVFFIVAGNWGEVKEEYNTYRDILWVDQPELYRILDTNPTSGALTFKTETFLTAMYNQVIKQNPRVEYVFKTDDDCYVDVRHLKQKLTARSQEKPVDYWGACFSNHKPYRNERMRWYVSYKDYPFTYYPKMCIGSGYVLSPKLLECAVGQGHIEKVPYFTNEDGAVGLLAERCGIEPSSFNDITRDLNTELNIRENVSKDLLMKNTIVQHNVKTEDDMLAMHESAMMKELR
jgi:hypothetical protein